MSCAGRIINHAFIEICASYCLAFPRTRRAVARWAAFAPACAPHERPRPTDRRVKLCGELFFWPASFDNVKRQLRNNSADSVAHQAESCWNTGACAAGAGRHSRPIMVISIAHQLVRHAIFASVPIVPVERSVNQCGQEYRSSGEVHDLHDIPPPRPTDRPGSVLRRRGSKMQNGPILHRFLGHCDS